MRYRTVGYFCIGEVHIVDYMTYQKINNNIKRLIFYFIGILFLGACSPTKFLSEEQSLLKKNEIILLDPENAVDKTKLKFELSQFYLQKPNTKLFAVFPKEWFYFKNSEPGDSSWYNNWLREDVGEIPTILNDSLTRDAAVNMYKYLVNWWIC